METLLQAATIGETELLERVKVDDSESGAKLPPTEVKSG